MSVAAATTAVAAAAARLVERVRQVNDVQPVQPVPPFNVRTQRQISNDFDELPCEQCAVPDDLRRAPLADFHCHICQLPGQAWEKVDGRGSHNLQTSLTTDGNFICRHAFCAGIWVVKCALDDADEDVKSAVAPKWAPEHARGDIYEALSARMLCYNIEMTKQLVVDVATPAWDVWYNIKLKKVHGATKSARKR